MTSVRQIPSKGGIWIEPIAQPCQICSAAQLTLSVGLGNLSTHAPVKIILGRVAVMYVQGPPKDGGALCRVQSFQHPAGSRAASNVGGGHLMFNDFRYPLRSPAAAGSSVDLLFDIRFGQFEDSGCQQIEFHLTHNMSSLKRGNQTVRVKATRKSTPTIDLLANVRLAPREQEVLVWAAEGKSAWETAMLLELSESTVKFYLRNACSRLGAQNKTHAVAICCLHDLFDN